VDLIYHAKRLNIKISAASKSSLAKEQRDSGETVVFAFKDRFLPL